MIYYENWMINWTESTTVYMHSLDEQLISKISGSIYSYKQFELNKIFHQSNETQ